MKDWGRTLRKTLGILFLGILLLTGNVLTFASESTTTLRVAFYPLTGFFEYDENGQESGFGVEVLNKISTYTGIRFVYIPADSWENTKQMLLDGKADVRMPGTLSATPSADLDYTQHSILDTYYAVMALKTRDDLYYEDYDTFAALKIGVSKDLYDAVDLEADLNQVNITADQLIFYGEYNDCREALKNNEVDAIISNIMDLDGEMKQLEKIQTVSNYISMVKGNEYLDLINEALSKLALDDPTFLAEEYKKWFPERIALPLTKEESTYLKSIDSLCFSFRDKQGYLSRKQQDGTFVGFYPDIAKLICKKLGISYEETEQTENDTAVVYLDFYYDNVWAKEVDVSITQPYFAVNYYEIIKKNTRLNKSTSNVAVIEQYRVTEDYIKSGYSISQMLGYSNYQECINAVESGAADVTYINQYAAEYFLNMYRYNGLSAFLTEYAHQICAAVSGPDKERLAKILDKTLSAVTTEQLDTFLYQNTSESQKQDYFQEWIYENPLRSICIIATVAAILAALCVLAVYVSRARKKNLALAKANHAKQEFLSRMSHDMRTPMNAIIGFSNFGQKTNSLKEAKEYHSKINQSGQYLLQLINDSLDLSKLQNGHYDLKLEPCWNTEFVASIETILRPLAQEKNIEFQIVCETQKPLVMMFDKIRLQQIFVNLLTNAVKFTPKGGHVSLEISNHPLTEDKRMIQFRVSDDGIGMSEDFQKTKLFQPFEQEHLEGNEAENGTENGTGLGLSIVKNLVDAMEGTISCKSIINGGTTFVVKIPAKTSKVQENPNTVPKLDITQLQGKRILLCEDHPLNREIAVKFLENEGMQVDVAVNGKQGVAMFEQSEPDSYFAILMDIRMPVMDGLTAARRIRQLNRKDAGQIAIIALSANTFSKDIEECKRAGMNAHLAKPIDTTKLYETLLKVNQQGV